MAGLMPPAIWQQVLTALQSDCAPGEYRTASSLETLEAYCTLTRPSRGSRHLQLALIGHGIRHVSLDSLTIHLHRDNSRQ